jgi:hypothetical protein
MKKKVSKKSSHDSSTRQTENQSSAANLLQRQITRFVSAEGKKPHSMTFEQLFTEIRTKPNPAQDEVRTLLKQGGGANGVIDELKATRFAAVTLSGVFINRKQISQHSGILQGDFDHLGNRLEEVRAKLIACQHVWAVWTSLSGDGLKALILIPADAERHKASYFAAEAYFKGLTNITIDRKCKDVTRLCFISHDPSIVVKHELLLPLPLPDKQKAKDQDLPATVTLSDERLNRLRRRIEENARLGDQIEWTTLDEQPVGQNCLCPATHCNERHKKATLYLLPRLPDYPLPTLNCHHAKCAVVVKEYNEWLVATYAEMCFASPDKFYRRESASDSWMQITSSGARTHLQRLGIPKAHCPFVLDYVADYYRVKYAGPLAGYKAGIRLACGSRILVTDSPTFIVAQNGTWPLLQKVLDGLFKTDRKSYEAFLAWAKLATEAIYKGIFRQSQVLCVIGPPNCGKSLLQAVLTALLGGRQADPYYYLAGHTDFNGELFGAEHQGIDDPRDFVDPDSRRALGSGIKARVTTREQRCHHKFQQALDLDPLWRLTISANEDLDSLQAMPLIDSDTADKLMILKADWNPMPLPTDSPEQHEALRLKLIAELPAFLDYLRHWKIPGWLTKGKFAARYGINSYHNEEMTLLLEDIAPENHIGRMLVQALFAGDKQHKLTPDGAEHFYQLSANQAEQIVLDYFTDGEMRFIARKLLRGARSMQNALGKLARKPKPFVFDDRIKSEGNRRVWNIYPPDYEVPSKPF